MSAILAILDRHGAPADGLLAQAMLAASPARAVDGQQVWTDGPIALAHAHFWITPEELHEEQPLVDASGRYAISADVRLDNRKALIADLIWEVGQPVSDAELLLQAYLKWGTKCVGRLLGQFVFVIWDAVQQQLFVARDALGARSAAYYLDDNLCIVASEIKQLLAHPQVPRRLNEGKVADFLIGLDDEHAETFYEGIHYCPPAHCLLVSAGSVRLWRYWDIDPDARIRYRTDAEYAEHFRQLLEQAVGACLRHTGPTAISLSGGLDSSAITALAVNLSSTEAVRPARIKCFSYVFDELIDCDERPYIQPLVDRYALDATFIPADDQWTLRNLPDWPLDQDTVFSDAYAWLPLTVLKEAQRAGCRVLLGGHYGDALYQGSTFWAADLLYELRLRTLLRLYCETDGAASWRRDVFDHGIRQLIPPRIKRAYRFWRPRPVWWYNAGMHPDLVQRTRLLARSNRDQSWRRFARPGQWQRYRGLIESATPQGAAAMRSLYARHGVQSTDPFFDRRLIEFVMAIPADQLGRPHCSKWILRNAMAGPLPDKVRLRIGKTSFGSLFDKGLGVQERQTVERLLADPQIAQRKFVRAEWLHTELQSITSWADDGYEAWLCISLELWLNRYW